MPETWEKKGVDTIAPTPYRQAPPPATSSLDPDWKRSHAEEDAVVVLDAGGAIQDLTPAARRLLDYRPGQPLKASFFSHVHNKDLYRVMRDVAEMTFHGRQQADWDLRLRTGQGRWHWFSASVGNQLNHDDQAIFIRLKEPRA